MSVLARSFWLGLLLVVVGGGGVLGEEPAAEQVLRVGVVPREMIFTTRHLAVEVGQTVEIVFANGGALPHALAVLPPGGRHSVGVALENLADADADAKEIEWLLSNLPEVLFRLPPVAAGKTETLRFTAPTTPGDYDYLSPLPDQWKTMQGTLHVVEDLPKFKRENPLMFADPQLAQRPFVREWKLEDLADDLERLGKGHSHVNGKKMMLAASCVACHKVGNFGGTIGQDLTKIGEMLAGQPTTPRELLRHILEPSLVIEPKYRTQMILTEAGEQFSGVITREDETTLELMESPLLDCDPIRIARADIDLQRESPVSIMPTGLLNTLTHEEILDLLAYLLAGGDAAHPLYQAVKSE